MRAEWSTGNAIRMEGILCLKFRYFYNITMILLAMTVFAERRWNITDCMSAHIYTYTITNRKKVAGHRDHSQGFMPPNSDFNFEIISSIEIIFICEVVLFIAIVFI